MSQDATCNKNRFTDDMSSLESLNAGNRSP